MLKKILQEGFILKQKGYYKHAIELFYKALEHDNTSNELMLEIADCYYLLKDEERALNYLEQILNTNPTHIEALKYLMKIFSNKKAWCEAEQTAKNIYCITQKSSDLAKIFEILNKQNNYKEIFEYNIEDNSTEVLHQKAYALMQTGDLKNAEICINKAIEQNNDNQNKMLKCKILFKMNRKNECFELLEQIVIDKQDPETFNFMGLIELNKYNLKKSLEYFLEAIKKDSLNDEYYYNCASAYFKMGEISQAKKYYNLAITLAPENQNYHFALANLYYSEGQYKRALEELDYDFFEAKLLKSVILFDSGYLAVAKKEFENLLKDQPQNELILNYLEKIKAKLAI